MKNNIFRYHTVTYLGNTIIGSKLIIHSRQHVLVDLVEYLLTISIH